MIENIGARLKSLCDDQGIALYLSEAESEDYPYAVYEADYVPSYDKDGVYKIVGDVIVRAYSKDWEEAAELATSVNDIILANFSDDGYTVRVTSHLKKECIQETWSVTYQFRITQYRQNYD